MLHDSDPSMREFGYSIMRNLASDEAGAQLLFDMMGGDAILDGIAETISVSTGSHAEDSTAHGNHSEPTIGMSVQNEAMWALANICAGPALITYAILEKVDLLTNLRTCLSSSSGLVLGRSELEVKKAAVKCLLALALAHGPRTRKVLVEVGILGVLRRMHGDRVGVGSGRESEREVWEDVRRVVGALEGWWE